MLRQYGLLYLDEGLELGGLVVKSQRNVHILLLLSPPPPHPPDAATFHPIIAPCPPTPVVLGEILEEKGAFRSLDLQVHRSNREMSGAAGNSGAATGSISYANLDSFFAKLVMQLPFHIASAISEILIVACRLVMSLSPLL